MTTPGRTQRGEPARLRAGTLVHLVYLLNLLWQPVFDPTSGWSDWALAAVAGVAVAALFVLAVLRPGRARWRCTVPITVLGALLTPFNSGAAVLFVYAAASAGVSESRRSALRWLLGLSILVSFMMVVSPVPMPWRLVGLLPSLLFLWIVGTMQIGQAERERAETELRIRNARIEHLAIISERERIARDLHDLLGHSLTAVVMRAQLIGVDPSLAQQEAAEIERTARQALTQVRRAVAGWRRASLSAEVDAARAMLESLGVRVEVRRDELVTLAETTEHELALALREAATNVARHADARSCHIDIGYEGDELRLVVADDGVGGDARDGNGLTGLRERIAALGGDVQRRGSAGTTVTIALPLRLAT
jgi:two-component system sensor histidine kinase DesK